MKQEVLIAAIRADYDRKMGSVQNGIKSAAIDQLLLAATMLAERLSGAPPGTTIHDMMNEAERRR